MLLFEEIIDKVSEMKKTTIAKPKVVSMAPAAKVEAKVEPKPKFKVIRLRSKTHKIRNPFNGQLFTPTKFVEIGDLGSPDNVWTKNQMRAGVLEEV